MKNEIRIGNRVLSQDSPVFIIAEAGVNHNGDLNLAKRLIDAASDAGVDAVKFQSFIAEKLATKDAESAEYQTANIGREEKQFEMLKRLELKRDFHPILKEYAESKGLVFISTPFDEDSIDYLDGIGVLVFKSGSGELNNLPYLKKMAAKGKPMIVSTGMSSLSEVESALNLIRSTGNEDVILLHCTTNYPCPVEEVNLKAIATMRSKFEFLVGYSDHTEGILASVASVSYGACVVEKHFTLDKKLDGPDHKASLNPEELKDMVRSIRVLEQMKGSGIKEASVSEMRIKQTVRKSIVTAQDIDKGTEIKEEMLIMKRPGTGIPPGDISNLLGRKTNRAIKKDELITYDMIAGNDNNE